MASPVRGSELLASPALAALVESIQPVELEAGAALFDLGEACTRLPLLATGGAAVYASDKEGRPALLYRLGPGEICPVSLSALMQQGLYPAWARAGTRVQVRYLPGEAFRTLIARDPETFGIFLNTFADSLQDITQRLNKP